MSRGGRPEEPIQECPLCGEDISYNRLHAHLPECEVGF